MKQNTTYAHCVQSDKRKNTKWIESYEAIHNEILQAWQARDIDNPFIPKIKVRADEVVESALLLMLLRDDNTDLRHKFKLIVLYRNAYQCTRYLRDKLRENKPLSLKDLDFIKEMKEVGAFDVLEIVFEAKYIERINRELISWQGAESEID